MERLNSFGEMLSHPQILLLFKERTITRISFSVVISCDADESSQWDYSKSIYQYRQCKFCLFSCWILKIFL